MCKIISPSAGEKTRTVPLLYVRDQCESSEPYRRAILLLYPYRSHRAMLMTSAGSTLMCLDETIKQHCHPVSNRSLNVKKK